MNSQNAQSVYLVILENNSATVDFIKGQLPPEFETQFVSTATAAEALLDTRVPDLFLCADDLVGEESGLMFLARTRDKWPSLRRILMMPDPDGDLFFTALKEVPLLTYLRKPLERRAFHRVIRHNLWEPAFDANQKISTIEPEANQLQSTPVAEITSTDVVILEADPEASARLISLLPWGFRHRVATTPEAATLLLDASPTNLFLCADDLPEESGLMFLARTQEKWAKTVRILMVPEPDAEFFFIASREMPSLAYLSKPIKKTELLHIIRHGLHDPLLEDSEEPEEEKVVTSGKKYFVRVLSWLAILLVGAVIAFGALVVIYQLKCSHHAGYLPSWLIPDYLER